MKVLRSVKEIEYDIQNILSNHSNPKGLLKQKYEMLKVCRLYILTNPSIEFIQKQLENANMKLLKIIEAGPKEELYRFTEAYKKDMDIYQKKEAVPHIRQQIKALEYLLSITD